MIIEKITRDLLSKEVTVDSLIKQLGSVVEKQRGSGYRLKHFDGLFNDIWIGIEKSQTEEVPRYIELTLSNPSKLTIAQMNAVFGEWVSSPRRDYDTPIVIKYIYDKPFLPFEGVIFVSLSGEPDAPDTRILSVTIRREKRL